MNSANLLSVIGLWRINVKGQDLWEAALNQPKNFTIGLNEIYF